MVYIPPLYPLTEFWSAFAEACFVASCLHPFIVVVVTMAEIAKTIFGALARHHNKIVAGRLGGIGKTVLFS